MFLVSGMYHFYKVLVGGCKLRLGFASFHRANGQESRLIMLRYRQIWRWYVENSPERIRQMQPYDFPSIPTISGVGMWRTRRSASGRCSRMTSRPSLRCRTDTTAAGGAGHVKWRRTCWVTCTPLGFYDFNVLYLL